jgi:hypothetical protein
MKQQLTENIKAKRTNLAESYNRLFGNTKRQLLEYDPTPSKTAKLSKDVVLTENLNPEVHRLVNGFIKKMANKYGYSLQDAVYAMMQVLRSQNYDGLNDGDEPTKAKVDEVESKELKVGEKVDVFNKGGKYQGWGRNEYLYNSEIVDITGEKVTVKDINDDEYEVDSSDISKLDESVAFPMWNKIK